MKTTTAVKRISSPESEEMITSFLNNHPQGVLTTIAKNGLPNSSVVNTFDIDRYHRAFMTKRTTRKFKNLLVNKAITFLSYDEFSRTELEVEGIAQLVTDKKREDEILKIIKKDAKNGRRHISPYVSDEDDYALFIIYPRTMHMATYWERENGIDAYHESIEFDLSMKA